MHVCIQILAAIDNTQFHSHLRKVFGDRRYHEYANTCDRCSGTILLVALGVELSRLVQAESPGPTSLVCTQYRLRSLDNAVGSPCLCRDTAGDLDPGPIVRTGIVLLA